jgi:putative transposase
MYDYRKMTAAQRAEVVADRKARHLPWHAPPHGDPGSVSRYLITAACFEHRHIIGASPARMTSCEEGVLTACRSFGAEISAWCILPNHYHVLVKSARLKELTKELGRFHGRSSNAWNDEEDCRGRKVWHRCFDRRIRSERHFWATVNYVHHNPVYHGYVEKWQDWPWSSAAEFLESVGREEAERIWAEYPILDYGKKWDIY